MIPALGRLLLTVGPPLAWAVAMAQKGRHPSGDGPHLLGTAARLAHQLRDGEWSTFADCFISLLGPHPPGAYVLATLADLLTGSAESAHLLAGAATLALCIDGILRLGGGWVGVIFLFSSGLIWLQAESYGVDLLAAACVIQAVSHLARSDALRHHGHALAWGAWMGAGFMTKYTAPIFLFGPCLLAGVLVLHRRRFGALAGAFCAFLAVAGPWYLTRLERLKGYIGAGGDSSNTLLTNKALMKGPWWAWDNASWYPATLLDGFGWPGVIALLAGVLAWPRRRETNWMCWAFPALAAGLGGLALAMQIQRQDRYLVPAVVLLCALGGSGITRWLSAPVASIGAYGAAAVFWLTMSAPATRSYAHAWSGAGADWPWVHEAYKPTSLDPDRFDVDRLLDRVRLYQGDAGTVGFLLDERGGAPGYGLILVRVGKLGLRWHIATVVLFEGRWGTKASTFVGPFTMGSWPSRRYSTLLTIFKPGDEAREAWLGEQALTLRETMALPGGREGRIYTR